ncbi:hypothetical protein JCM11251_004170 [Rhodosporidiobolus azoricus]
MLAEQLVEMYEEDEEGMRKVAGEAEEAVAKTLSIAQSHSSLQAYQAALLLLQARLSLATRKPLKYTRQLIRRLLSLLPDPSSPSFMSSATPAQAAAFYAAHSLSATLPHRDVSDTERASSWNILAEAAERRGDSSVAVVATLAQARLALEAEDFPRVSALISSLETALGGDTGEGGDAGTREARIMYRLMRTIVLAQTDVKAAKEMLKGTHKLLDTAADAAGGASDSGTVRTVILPSESASTFTQASTSAPSASLTFHLPPHATLYPFTFHLSTSLHLDPFGRSPRSLLFGAEGLRGASARLNARDGPPAGSALASPGAVRKELDTTAKLKVGLHLACARLWTMRGEYEEAVMQLKEAVETARGWGFWHVEENAGGEEEANETREAVTLAWGLNRLARAARDGEDEKEAETCFEAVIASSAPSSAATAAKKGAKNAASGDDAHLNPRRAHGRRLAMLSLLLLRMSAPALSGGGASGQSTIPSFAAGSPSPSPTKTFGHALPSPSPSPAPPSPFLAPSTLATTANYTSLSTLLFNLTSTPLQSLLDSHPPTPTSTYPAGASLFTSSDLLSLLAHAVTAREITTLKKALTAALNATNELQSNWVRMGVLGILGVVFGWTREGEAHKMLSSSYKLAASMGPPTRNVSVPSVASSYASASSIFPGAPAAETVGVGKDGGVAQVGYARMQAWVGERLLQTYRSNPSLASPQQVQEMQRGVEACHSWLIGVERGAAESVKKEGPVLVG